MLVSGVDLLTRGLPSFFSFVAALNFTVERLGFLQSRTAKAFELDSFDEAE
jgi:hypothetical protein